MGVYYVRKTGNDSTGDGSTATPWLTVSKANLTVPIAGGHTVNIGPGVYQEDSGSGYLDCSRTFLDYVTFQSETGIPSDVTIQGLSSTSYEILYKQNATYYEFKNLTLAMRTNATVNGAIRVSYANYLKFTNVTFTCLTSNSTVRYGLYIVPSGTNNIQHVYLTNCTFNFIGSDNATMVRISGLAGYLSDDITFTNCTLVSTGYGLQNDGGTNVIITGGKYTSPGIPILYGADGTSNPFTPTGKINFATAISTASHTLLVGAGCSGVQVNYCNITGGDLGLVFKECSGGQAIGNVIRGGTTSSLYFKAATGVTASYNNILNTVGGWAIEVGYGDTNNKSGNLTITHNKAKVTGASPIFRFPTATEDSGGCVIDYNTYDPKSTAKLGAVRAAGSVLTLAALKTAWAGYAGANDAHSKLFKRSKTKVRV